MDALSLFLGTFAERVAGGASLRVLVRENAYAIVELDLSSMFRRLRGSVRALVMTYVFAEEMLRKDPAWIEMQLLALLDDSAEDTEVIPVFLVGSGARQFVNRHLSDLPILRGQPIINGDSAFGTKRLRADLRKVFSGSTDLRLLSPYAIDKLAARRMFFGRQHDLAEMKSDRSNLFLVGARRVGKSSLALRLMEELGRIKLPPVAFRYPQRELPRCIYVDVGGLPRPVSKSIWGKILREFEIERRDLGGGGWRVDLLGKRPKGDAIFDETKAVQALFRRFEGKLTVVLDEVDRWIQDEADLSWPSLEILRSFSDNGCARLILVGYESLSLAARYHRFPLMARGQYKVLGPLDRRSTESLVVEPLEELNILLEPRSREQILNRIWRTTSGFPHLIQDICAGIVSLVVGGKDGTSKATALLTMTELDDAIERSGELAKFRERIVDKDFPLARAVAAVCSLSRASTPHKDDEIASAKALTIGEISRRLEESDESFNYSTNDFELALTSLELRSVLQPVNPERTRWIWVNELARQSMENIVKDIGHKRFLNDLVREHQRDAWRALFTTFRGNKESQR